MAGRKPKPTQLKLITGNPGKRPLNQDEPKYCDSIPPCPLDLDEVGRRTWDEKSRIMHDAGVLTEADGHTLALYCRIWSQIVLLAAEVQTPEDYVYNQKASRLEKLYAEYRAYSALLGMDPANRTRIKANPVQKAPESKERFF